MGSSTSSSANIPKTAQDAALYIQRGGNQKAVERARIAQERARKAHEIAEKASKEARKADEEAYQAKVTAQAYEIYLKEEEEKWKRFREEAINAIDEIEQMVSEDEDYDRLSSNPHRRQNSIRNGSRRRNRTNEFYGKTLSGPSKNNDMVSFGGSPTHRPIRSSRTRHSSERLEPIQVQVRINEEDDTVEDGSIARKFLVLREGDDEVSLRDGFLNRESKNEDPTLVAMMSFLGKIAQESLSKSGRRPPVVFIMNDKHDVDDISLYLSFFSKIQMSLFVLFDDQRRRIFPNVLKDYLSDSTVEQIYADPTKDFIGKLSED